MPTSRSASVTRTSASRTSPSRPAARAGVGAVLAISFGHSKIGLSQLPGLELAGRVLPVGIGIPPAASADLPYEQLEFRSVKETMPRRPARASPRPLLAAGLPDAVHEPLVPAAGAAAGELDGRAARALLRALGSGGLRRAGALLVGPGIGTGRGARAFVADLLGGLDAAASAGTLRALVLDADALSMLSRLPGWGDRLALPRVLTPHPGEMARLAGCSVAEVQSDRLRSALDAARQTGSTVVLKGACTVVAGPDGRARISDQANPMLATAGTGDVLAGLVAGLLAQGMDPFDAASAAVYIHGDCGRRVAESHGAAAGLAQDLLRALPEVSALLEGRSRGDASGIGVAPGLLGGPGGGAETPPAAGSLW